MKIVASLLLTLMIFLQVQTLAMAQTATPKAASQTVTDTLSEQITDLKEKIASRVAELDLVEKKGIVGIASDVDDTQVTITDIYGKPRVVDIDEITNFTSPDDEESFGISDIEPGMKISVLGLYNKETERLLARFVTVVSLPQYIAGQIDQIDEDGFVLSVTGQNDVAYEIDVETSTTTQQYIDEDFERSGFSDLKVGQDIFVTGYEDEDDTSRISASRILIVEPASDEEEESPTLTPNVEDEE